MKTVIEIYTDDIWNGVDACVIVFSLIGTITRMVNRSDNDFSVIILSIASIFVWFKLLYYMRAYHSSGPLIAMVISIAYDIRYYILILFIVLCGFSQAFFLLSYLPITDNTAPPMFFSTVQQSFLYTYVFMLGSVNLPVQFASEMTTQFGTVLFIIFTIFMGILMFNLLIALMSDTYQRIQNEGLGRWRYEQASIILDYVSI